MDASTSVEQPGHQSGTTRSVVRYLIREAMGLLMLAAMLFLSAGRLDWVMGWALVGIMLAWSTATALVVVARNPGLLAERTGPKKGAKTWDMVLLSIIGLTTIARCIVAGLDERFGWTTTISLPLQIATLAVAVMGYALVVWATVANPFFSQVVRIQKERGHTVATGGPYRFVRHPGNVGTILFEIAVPVMLGSWWALIPGGLSALLSVVRTALEDKTLLDELDGYREY
ncbi:MAG TPA: isoprenylcysteine carboxylmethyltransferase family protein, partial [Chloroflexi bacterium]|nr:isoprenylcysteine carboxylmethyltransferase family protein [Chloroflexota bacterium]